MAGRRKKLSKRLLVLLIAIDVGVACLVVGGVYRLVMPGALFLVRFMDGTAEGDAAGEPYAVRETSISAGERAVPVRVYAPEGGHDHTLVVVHGVHWGGYDEKRLVHFARRLAAMGRAVITPDVAGLKAYEIGVDSLEDIIATARWALEDSGLVEGGGKVGLYGISFAGGLCLAAAARPELAKRVSAVFSFGGHGDLDRTMRFLATGETENGLLKPHVYGQVVLVRRFADELVPPEEVAPLRTVLLDYLHERWKAVRAAKKTLGDESRQLVQLCLKRQVKELGSLLAPLVAKYRSDPSLSPVRGPAPRAPVFLLHGASDRVIPPSETRALEKWASPHTDTTSLVSDLITHVELGNEEKDFEWTPYYEIVRFWTELLRSG
jgi:dienelactone hydrolase